MISGCCGVKPKLHTNRPNVKHLGLARLLHRDLMYADRKSFYYKCPICGFRPKRVALQEDIAQWFWMDERRAKLKGPAY